VSQEATRLLRDGDADMVRLLLRRRRCLGTCDLDSCAVIAALMLSSY
jgi:hypothetical protein